MLQRCYMLWGIVNVNQERMVIQRVGPQNYILFMGEGGLLFIFAVLNFRTLDFYC